MVTEEYCYQETANVSTACGGKDTGVYWTGGAVPWTNPALLYDGDWSTGARSSTPVLQSFMWINYTLPNGAVYPSLWQVKDDYGFVNLTIPQECMGAVVQFKLVRDRKSVV